MLVSSNVHTNSRLDRSQGIRQTPVKVTNKAPMTVPKAMEIHELLDKSFRIIILKKLSVLQKKIYTYMQSRKQYMNKIRRLTNKYCKNELNSNTGTEEYND